MDVAAFQLGSFLVDPGTDRLVDLPSGSRISLEPKTMAVLLCLAEVPGRVVSSEELIHQVWADRPMGENPVYKAIAKLRRAFEDDRGEPQYIGTVPRKGYRLLVAPARPDPTTDRLIHAAPARTAGGGSWLSTWPKPAFTGLVTVFLAIGLPGFIADSGSRPVSVLSSADERGSESAGLSLEARQVYQLAKSELRERRPGFAPRLRSYATQLIALAPDFAEGHALRSVACSFEAAFSDFYSVKQDEPVETERTRDMTCAGESADQALQRDPQLALASAAAGFAALNEACLCTTGCNPLGALDAARSSLQRAIRLDPTMPEARTWLLLVDKARGDFGGAERQAEAALALDPLNPVTAFNVNEFLMDRGDYALVRKRLLPLARPGAPPYVYLQLAFNAVAVSDGADAQRWIRQLLAEDNSRDSHIAAAFILVRLGDVAQARRLAGPVGGGDWLDQGETLWRALSVYQALDGPQGAARYLASQRAVRSARSPGPNADDRDWQAFQGWALVMTGDAAGAKPYLERAFGASGPPRLLVGDIVREADGADALAWTYARLGKLQRSREVADATLVALDRIAGEGYGRYWPFVRVRALTLELAGRPSEAQAVLLSLPADQRPSSREGDPRWSIQTGHS